ncbi:MAG: gliding motility protein GldN [Bacteroidetes bacterium]|nr:gliding motility protein GldN [Bacteroidota bacterium]
MKRQIFITTTLLVVICLASFSQNVLDGVCIKEHTPKKKFIPYTPLREADVLWSKRIWRIIDLREKINHQLYYPTDPINDRKNLFDVIKSALTTGQLTAYANPVTDDEFKAPMTKSEIEGLFIKLDTNYIDDGTGNMVATPVQIPLESSKIIQYCIKEDWFFDKQRSVMDVRIVGIAPMMEKTSESGEVQGYQRLFWIYYPEARPVFANAEVYNRGNESERRTLEDIFWKRQFGSYIIKESNVYDRTINQYKTGLDALLEAERIKEEIFEFEHDMWHL